MEGVLLLPLSGVLFAPPFSDDGFVLKLRGLTSFFLKSELSLSCNGTLAGTLCPPVVLEFFGFFTACERPAPSFGNDAVFCGAGFNSPF